MRRRPLRQHRPEHSSGASAVEYALIVAGIAVAVVAVLGGLQSQVRNAYVATGASIGDVNGVTAAPAPGGGSSTPAGGSSTPAGGSSTPAGGSSTPAGGSSTPAGGSSTPAGGSSTPAGGSSTPAGGGQTSTPATPTPTPPAGAITVPPGGTVNAAALGSGEKVDVPAPAASPASGTVTWVNGVLQFQASAGAPAGPVTITYTTSKGNKTTTTTVVVWVV